MAAAKRKVEMSLKEVIALITLLDDPDEVIYDQVKDRFVVLGPPAIPHLETAWENSFDAIMQKRIESIIHTIQFETLQKALKDWAKTDQDDLLKGIIILARYQYPDLDENKIKKQLATIKQDVWLELHEDLTALEKVKIINHVLFEIHQFSGNITNYHAPQNSFLNNVLESKKGNPLMLSVVYLLICIELKIPVYGINLPQHFVLAYLNEEANLMDVNNKTLSNNILFYINPFSKGLLFNQKDIDQFLKQLNLDLEPKYYLPCNNIDIIKRCINNLIFSYEKLGYLEKVEELKGLDSQL
ncbi:MAG: transglutaminase-like domain-containing protein [Bacteroidota bacterium]|nr:transglutaminase-like domain-containing protein [Bacteroidota bacterium]MDP3145179.1 transglutaminase-like domain-containing protein [Bacteroidota bacterium]MDP3557295.1 transglutaminase-like domain-containing protein [Bacteroidota bacterium]